MAEPKKKGEGDKKGPFKEQNRGTQDELEILGLIVMHNPALKTLVFDRLRSAKNRVAAREQARGKTDAKFE